MKITKLVLLVNFVILLAIWVSLTTCVQVDERLPKPPGPLEDWTPPDIGQEITLKQVQWQKKEALGPETPPDLFSAYLEDTRGQPITQVEENESWFLVIQVGRPGYFYLYEYYPKAGVPSGRWLIYRHLIPDSGIWRGGPFDPEPEEPGGERFWRMWFLPKETPLKALIQWDYVRVEPAVTPVPITQTNWFRYLLIGLLVIAAGAIGLLVVRRRQPRRVILPIIKAKLILPDNTEILLPQTESRVIGREDLCRLVSASDLTYVSRRHLKIGFEKGEYYVTDLNTQNGTKLNRVEIKGRGRQKLKPGDEIDIAGVATLIFRI